MKKTEILKNKAITIIHKMFYRMQNRRQMYQHLIIHNVRQNEYKIIMSQEQTVLTRQTELD